jgi:hypothetical protein
VKQVTSDVFGTVASLGLRFLLERYDGAMAEAVLEWDPALGGRNPQPCTPMRAPIRS